MKHPIVKYTVIIALMAGLFYLAFRGQNISEALAAIKTAHFLPLIAGVILMLVSHAVRAYRWQIVLRPIKKETSFWRAYKATIAGYAMNNIIPRSGEVTRPYILAKGEKIPLSGVVASIVVERLTDVLALAVLLAFSLATFNEPLRRAFPMITTGTIIGMLTMVAVLFLFIGLFFSERRTRAITSILFRPLPTKLSEKLTTLTLQFSEGLRGLDRRSLLPLLAGSAGIWLIYGLSMYISLQGFSIPQMQAIPLSGAFLLLTLSGVAFTVPTPGGSGTYHYFISQGLALIFGVPQEIALAYAILTHALSYVVITVSGLVILLTEGLSFGKSAKLQTSLAGEHQREISAVPSPVAN